ncbi:zinc ribbon domain-containing protein [uncultured Ruminococcus sp.]|uniref:zinc ribbon domain-containing protein n=1 Tax=uncultured Ruminococcus sp. TaxID=165186 RepID=UPI00261B5138|nr:zinc ribbon domain-containing protein [uncultured Ruminococcus sp.]
MGFVESVKDIAGKFGESVERGAKTVSNSSKKFAEKTKMKREIARVQSDINTDYIELGKVLFEKIADDPDSEYASIAADIKEKSANLEELKALLMTLEDKITCSNCGAHIRKDQAYCDKCGTKVEIITPETSETATESVFSSDDVE